VTDDEDPWGLRSRGPYRDGRVHVLDRLCRTCVFRPGNLMQLRPGRLRSMVAEAIAGESAITCHSTLGTDRPAICRGYFNRYADRVWRLRLALGWGLVTYDPPPDKGAS
jgi:hypothetical protein